MNNKDEKYAHFALCREMLEAAGVMETYVRPSSLGIVTNHLFITGEGSSRLFPAKHMIYRNRKRASRLVVETEGATQSLEYSLSDRTVIGISNSGKTNELIRLFQSLRNSGHSDVYGVTAQSGSPLEKLTRSTHVLGCGGEMAVAATKSVVEQALYIQSIVSSAADLPMDGLRDAGGLFRRVLELPLDPLLIRRIAEADTIYFAGRNNGVAEELTLKTNEITRKKSGYLEGTYLLHGMEEVLTEKDVIIVIDPFESGEQKMLDCLVNRVGVTIISISTRDTLFPTMRIPDGGEFHNYLELAAGWNLLVETGLVLGIDLDKPVRARKVGNEFMG